MERLFVILAVTALAQPLAGQTVTGIVAEPERVQVTAGQSVPIVVRAIGADGQTVDAPLRIAGPRRGVRVANGQVTGIAAGEYEIFVASISTDGGAPIQLRIPVTVGWPAVEEVVVLAEPGRLFAGTRILHRASASHADGTARPYPEVTWSSSDESVATVDPFGNVRGVSVGSVTITASVDGITGSLIHEVEDSPVTRLELRGGQIQVRTGDVQSFDAAAYDAQGSRIDDVPLSWSYLYQADDSIRAPAGPAQIEQGRMVADVPGVYTAVASTGSVRAEFSFRVVSRNAVRTLDVVGQGRESRVFTTDLWIWEGVDGRDYALTGSKFGDGISMVWDVTDPSNIFKTDSIQVDARTTNDVKASPDGRYAAISREGASNRRNGVVILDLTDPAHPRVASTFEGNGVTGGVHNMYATEDYLFALAGGDKYVIIDVRDLANPRYVSEYNHPNSRVHDVWVHDGLAYSAEWETGIVVVDVGNGEWGGSIENPVFVTSFPLTTGSTHAVFPYYQESTGRMLLIVGDERVQRNGLAWQGTGPDHRQQYNPETGKGGYPRATSGYTQIVDFTDPMNPVQLARYEVSEYGTHNMWVENDILYQAYYEGGVRMVDISGDLMGNLYTQGRELSVFKAFDPLGYIPNSAAAWGVMPWKGNIFFADINSGMWAVQMQPTERPVS
ncbi:MAG: Ig-like domain-containing protein [Gemmatimonadota bacterium]|nr:Ig-like domain-containing protein [Gemmatimonadota bacterium]MDE3006050.1 Ig-like domain-containing protein [Gemmatimonadota bacterium]MDE3015051.1 Ig-like domain-containing protein [Gemmatimonadota bacterium]